MGKKGRDKENFDVSTLLILLVILYAYSHETEEDYDSGASKNKSKEHFDSGGDYPKGSINNTDKALDNRKGSSLKESLKASKRDKVNDCGIVSSEVIPEYPNKLIIQEGSCNYIAINVPVLLSQFEIEFDCETTIELDSPAVDIKRSKKNVYLDECILIPKVKKLFLSGIVKKNIEYGAENNIRHITMEVPFKCTTEVQYYTPPIIATGTEQLEIETLRADGKGADLSEKTFISSEKFNEKIYCILVSDEISELLTADEDSEDFEGPEGEKLFYSLTEKMVVKLNLKLLQKQQINISKEMLK